jgi:hypothetical protein
VVNLSEKQAVIGDYEVSLASKIVESGFQAEALFTLASKRNMTIYHWEKLGETWFSVRENPGGAI